MDLHVVPSSNGDGVFRLLSSLSTAQRLLLDHRAEQDPGFDPLAGDLYVSLPDELESDPQESPDEQMTLSLPVMDLYGCWWKDDVNCTHGDNPAPDSECECGPVTFLEVATHIVPSDRQLVFDVQVARVSELWDHFWSGEAIMSQKSSELGAACAECLLHPRTHLADVVCAAQEAAAEFGEALAAFHVSIAIGTPRWS